MPCSEDLIWVHLVFWPMVAVSLLMVARHNRFGLKNTLLALVGLKKFKRTVLINIFLVVTMVLPVGFGLWLVQSCLT